MNDQLRSIPQPLIPLPSPTKHCDPRDPFDGLFADPAPLNPLFVVPQATERPKQGDLPTSPSSVSSEFGPFVSVPPSKHPLYQDSGDDDDGLLSFSPSVEAPSSSKFFERFTVEAKERAGENERRVLDELLEHEDDPLYWLHSHATPHEDTSSSNMSTNALSDENQTLPSHPQCTSSPDMSIIAVPDEIQTSLSLHERTPSPRIPQQSGTVTPPFLPENSPGQPASHARQDSSSPLSPTLTSTLSRKWTLGLLSNPVVVPARTTMYDPVASPPHFISPSHDSVESLTHSSINPLHDSVGSLTHSSTGSMYDSVGSLKHSSPFAPHAYIPPSGAPGFTGDRFWNKAGFEFEFQQEEKGHVVQLTGRREETTPVLTNEVADQLRANLPALQRLVNSWSLLYSLDQHGISLQTFYAKCASRKGGTTMLVIRDSEDRVFGVWLGEQIRMSPGAYYGRGDSFLWTSTLNRARDNVKVFKWTGKNDYVALCEPDFISFGGGEGKYGLYLDSNLTDGSSARCPTFDNEVLCSRLGYDTTKTVPFECVGLEAWAIVN